MFRNHGESYTGSAGWESVGKGMEREVGEAAMWDFGLGGAVAAGVDVLYEVGDWELFGADATSAVGWLGLLGFGYCLAGFAFGEPWVGAAASFGISMR